MPLGGAKRGESGQIQTLREPHVVAVGWNERPSLAHRRGISSWRTARLREARPGRAVVHQLTTWSATLGRRPVSADEPHSRRRTAVTQVQRRLPCGLRLLPAPEAGWAALAQGWAVCVCGRTQIGPGYEGREPGEENRSLLAVAVASALRCRS